LRFEHRAWTALYKSSHDLVASFSIEPVLIFSGGVLITSVSAPSISDLLRELIPRSLESYKFSHDEAVPLGKDSALIYRVEAKRERATFTAAYSSASVLDGNENYGITVGDGKPPADARVTGHDAYMDVSWGSAYIRSWSTVAMNRGLGQFREGAFAHVGAFVSTMNCIAYVILAVRYIAL